MKNQIHPKGEESPEEERSGANLEKKKDHLLSFNCVKSKKQKKKTSDTHRQTDRQHAMVSSCTPIQPGKHV